MATRKILLEMPESLNRLVEVLVRGHDGLNDDEGIPYIDFSVPAELEVFYVFLLANAVVNRLDKISGALVAGISSPVVPPEQKERMGKAHNWITKNPDLAQVRLFVSKLDEKMRKDFVVKMVKESQQKPGDLGDFERFLR